MSAHLISEIHPGIVQYLLCQLHRLSLDSGHTKPAFEGIAGYIAAFYLVFAIVTLSLNMGYVWTVFRSERKNDYIFMYLNLLCICNMLAVLTILPLSMVTQVTYWRYGSFMCHHVTLVQEFFAHAMLLTLALLAIQRYRELRSTKSCVWPVWMGFSSVLIVSICCAYPGSFFILFYSAKQHLRLKDDVQVCLEHSDQRKNYAYVMLVLMYIAPLVVVIFCFAKIRSHLRNQASNNLSLLNIPLESCTQRYLILIILLTTLSRLPLNLSSVIQLTVPSGCDFSKIQLCYCAFIWISFMQCISTPILALRLLHKSNVLEVQIVRRKNNQVQPAMAQCPSDSVQTCTSTTTRTLRFTCPHVQLLQQRIYVSYRSADEVVQL